MATTPPKERTVYLIRHGELDTRAFAKHQRNAGLTARGRQQARLTAQALRGLSVSAIHCSTLGRARETARIIADVFPGVNVQVTSLLWELPHISSNVAPRTVIAREKARGARAFARFVRPTYQRRRIEILVSHGNLIRYMVCRTLGIAPESCGALGTSHCGITVLSIVGRQLRVICYNDTRHLPVRLRT
jgi:serine/threonine-protein phosphatase PGAM5